MYNFASRVQNGQTDNGLQGNVNLIATVVLKWSHRWLAVSTVLRVIGTPQ